MKNAILGTAVATGLLAVAIPTATAQAGNTVAAWEMNEGRKTNVLRDSVGNFNGSLGEHVVTNGRYHHFDQHNRKTTAPGHINVVPDNDSLDPGFSNFAVVTRIRFTSTLDRNIVQKGQSAVNGRAFKMKARGAEHAGFISCLFRGSDGDSYVDSNRSLANGKWHTIQCKRTNQGTVMRVDGVVTERNDNDPGSIDNDWPIAIGGNTSCWEGAARNCNYWWGDIDYIRWMIG